ncbi:MAG TPA: metallophosphoesterase [Polyangia bacterium]|jgi:hypothetical protein|nr:metallophosphoesterase [Polyangia bacterium]
MNRRDVLSLLGVGGVVFSSALAGAAGKKVKSSSDSEFFFLQLSDTHWGYSGPANPAADVTLAAAVKTINGVASRPDFIVFTGDLTHNTDDVAVRHQRMTEFDKIVSGLDVKQVRLMPGEHDASQDRGAAYQQHFGAPHYAFDHKGVHFVALDNVSDPKGAVGADQIDWLAARLKPLSRDAPIVVFTHRPLFDLYPQWEWATADGAKVIDVLMPYRHVTVFYGHIHQEHHHQTEHIRHHAARSLIFPLPAPGSAPRKAPIPWDAAAPYKGLGYRSVALDGRDSDPLLAEFPINRGP